jgi:hypothetical protein
VRLYNINVEEPTKLSISPRNPQEEEEDEDEDEKEEEELLFASTRRAGFVP